ncbi:MAG: IclR family transcriptional regulator [Thermoanaerobaculia bacterium]
MLPQAMRVLSLFTVTRSELGVAEVAKMLSRPKSTISGWMSAMHDVGLLDRANGGTRYRLGIRLAAFGELAKRATSAQIIAAPLLEQLAKRTKETTTLNVLIGTEIVNTFVIESPQPIHSGGGLGIPMPIHATAAGKVLVAWKTPEEIRHLLPLRLEQFTEETVTDATEFVSQLAVVRKQGYSTATGELAHDLFVASAPVRDSSGSVIAAISIAAPTSRVPAGKIPALAQDLVQTAAAVSAGLGYVPAVLDAASTD